MILAIGAILVATALAACGAKGSSGTPQQTGSASGAGCAPVAGDQLVVLTDDQHLQSADNVIAAIHTPEATPALIAAVDKVADALDTPKLVALNKAVGVDRKTEAVAAQEFATTAGLTAGLSGGSGKIVVGYANFPESQILAELYKIVLTAAGFQVSTQAANSREIYEPALEKGEINVFPEYAATLTEFLNKKANGANPPPKASGDINATVTALKELGGNYHLTFGKPSAAADQNAFAVTKAAADKYGVHTLTEFGAKCSGKATVLAGPAECPTRSYCQIGLHDTYKLTVGSFQQTDAGGPQTKTALKTGTATIGLVFSSDASLTAS